MPRWECDIEGDNRQFDHVEELIIHQSVEHDRIECKVCGAVVPDGYFAIRHAFDEHSRAEYVRAYDADSAAVRRREEIKREIEREADLQRVVDQLDRSP
jgi:transcription initiation factor TFIIIB Brf1 subunit/transcription initiation factor TFIIB